MHRGEAFARSCARARVVEIYLRRRVKWKTAIFPRLRSARLDPASVKYRLARSSSSTKKEGRSERCGGGNLAFPLPSPPPRLARSQRGGNERAVLRNYKF